MEVTSRQPEKQRTLPKSFFLIGFSIVFQLFSEVFLEGCYRFLNYRWVCNGRFRWDVPGAEQPPCVLFQSAAPCLLRMPNLTHNDSGAVCGERDLLVLPKG